MTFWLSTTDGLTQSWGTADPNTDPNRMNYTEFDANTPETFTALSFIIFCIKPMKTLLHGHGDIIKHHQTPLTPTHAAVVGIVSKVY